MSVSREDIDIEINSLLNIKDRIQDHISEYLKSDKNTLDEKWDLFSTLDSSLFKEHGWIIHLPELDKHRICWYNDFYIERHKTVDLVDIVFNIEENRAWYEELGNEPEEDDKTRLIDLEQLKKEILECGYRTFVFDW